MLDLENRLGNIIKGFEASEEYIRGLSLGITNYKFSVSGKDVFENTQRYMQDYIDEIDIDFDRTREDKVRYIIYGSNLVLQYYNFDARSCMKGKLVITRLEDGKNGEELEYEGLMTKNVIILSSDRLRVKEILNYSNPSYVVILRTYEDIRLYRQKIRKLKQNVAFTNENGFKYTLYFYLQSNVLNWSVVGHTYDYLLHTVSAETISLVLNIDKSTLFSFYDMQQIVNSLKEIDSLEEIENLCIKMNKKIRLEIVCEETAMDIYSVTSDLKDLLLKYFNLVRLQGYVLVKR